MSAASTPVPRTKSSSDRPSTPRHTLFWPMLIFLGGAGSLAFYQVLVMEDRWDQITQTIDKMDTQVKRGQYEKAKFFSIARDVLLLAPKDPNANAVAEYYKLKQLQEARPELLALSTSPESSDTNAPSAKTNAAPVQPAPATNSAPLPAAAPANN